MTYLGGAREYYVPPISNGLMVNGLGSIVAPSLLEMHHDSPNARAGSERASSNGGSSESSSLRNEPIRASASIRNQSLVGTGLPSASSLSLSHMNSSFHSQHNLYGPPLKSIYAKKTWSNRIPTENLASEASGSESHAKKKSSRAPETAFYLGQTQADRAPDDVVNAIFKGIPVGGSHNGQLSEGGPSLRPLSARTVKSSRPASATEAADRTPLQKPGKTPNKVRPRVRTMSSASSLSKRSERSFSFGLSRSKDKDKEKDAAKQRGKQMENDKAKGKKGSVERSKATSSAEADSPTADKGQGFHLSVPGQDPGKWSSGRLVESPSASTEALRPSASATRVSAKRLSSVRWNIDGDDAASDELRRSQDTTPVAETFDQYERDRAAMPPPPSVVVNHAYIPIRAGGITAASSSAINLVDSSAEVPREQNDSTAGSNAEFLSPQPNSRSTPSAAARDSESASIRSFASSTSALDDDKKLKTSSHDLKGLYQAGLAIPQSLSTSTAVGLDRIKRTSRAIGQFAKDAVSSGRPGSRPSSSSGAALPTDSQGVAGRERRSKGNRGIEPSEAASKGWHGAGWLRPISTSPAPLPPGSPDLSSAESDGEFEDADVDGSSPAYHRGSLISHSSEGRRSSATDQTASSDAPATPRAAAVETFRPAHKRDKSFVSVYHDVDDEDWPEDSAKLMDQTITPSVLPMQAHPV